MARCDGKLRAQASASSATKTYRKRREPARATRIKRVARIPPTEVAWRWGLQGPRPQRRSRGGYRFAIRRLRSSRIQAASDGWAVRVDTRPHRNAQNDAQRPTRIKNITRTSPTAVAGRAELQGLRRHRRSGSGRQLAIRRLRSSRIRAGAAVGWCASTNGRIEPSILPPKTRFSSDLYNDSVLEGCYVAQIRNSPGDR